MRSLRWLGLTLPALFFVVFFVVPIGNLLLTAFGQEGGAARALNALAAPGLRGVVAFTVWQALLSTALVLALALPGAAVLVRFAFPGRGLIEALTVVAFVMPTVVVATAVGLVLADDGPLGALLPDGSDRGLTAILVAHLYFNLGVALRMISAYWARLDPRVSESAAALGAGPWRVFRLITLPRLRPAILAAGAIVFLFTFTSFGIVLLLGGPGQATIEVEIQRQVLFLFDIPTGAALSVLQMVLVIVILVVQSRLGRHGAPSGGTLAVLPRRPATATERLTVFGFVVLALLFLAGPVLMVLLRALRVGDGYGWGNFTALGTARSDSILFVPPAEAIANSLAFAIGATAIAVTIGGAIAWSIAGRVDANATWEGIWLLPLGVSAVTLGFGVLITFDEAPLNWRATPWLVPVVQALVAIPFVVRALVPALRAINPRVREAARSLGASGWVVFRFVELPMVSRALAVAVGFSFAISLGEFGATVFVARGDHPTVPIAIYRLLGTPGESNQGQAMALAVVLIVLTAAAVLLTDRLRVPGQRHV